MIKKSFFRLSILVITSIGLFFTYSSQASDNHNSEPSSILILGDSLSASFGMKENQGWVYQLNEALQQQKASYTLINASISGETTASGLTRLPRILAKQNIDYLLVELGGNDGLRGYPPTLIKNNLLQIIQLAQQKNIKVFLMDIKIPPNYGTRYNKLFNQTFTKVANISNISLLPFFMESIAIKPELMQTDGIHPNIKAQPLIVAFMKQQLDLLVTSPLNK
ncbi:arylesterase [Candidatus Colwellia aromaticivorans]|uniref:arylesterase n=1 Tax=Candidatus Colwellia aromaticivorans TaxID=2267621 RepID=UPI000DF3FF48|nr:arylesterase [Candidatus Colwellia aromaticivorans]